MTGSTLGAVTRRLDGARYRVTARRELAQLRARLPDMLRASTVPPAGAADVRGAAWTRSGVAVFILGGARNDLDSDIVLKATRHSGAAESLRRQHATLDRLQAIDALDDWRGLLPRPLAYGVLADVTFVVETALPGRPATHALSTDVIDNLMRAIRPLHDLTGVRVVVDDARLARWVAEPIGRIDALACVTERQRTTLAALRARLCGAMHGATRRVSWIHGDYWPDNVLVDALSVPGGIVDWDRAAPDELPLHDALHLLLYARKLAQRCALGAVVADQLATPAWSPAERAILTDAAGQPELIGDSGAVALYWLRHVGENLRRNPGYAANVAWLRSNVAPVLDALEGRL